MLEKGQLRLKSIHFAVFSHLFEHPVSIAAFVRPDVERGIARPECFQQKTDAAGVAAAAVFVGAGFQAQIFDKRHDAVRTDETVFEKAGKGRQLLFFEWGFAKLAAGI
jgi:hypothetical protein